MVSVSVLQLGKWLPRLSGLCPGEGVTQACPWTACRWVPKVGGKTRLSPGCQAGGAEAHSSFPGHVAGLLRNCWGRSGGQGTWPKAPAWAVHRSMWQSRDSCSRLLTQEVGGGRGWRDMGSWWRHPPDYSFLWRSNTPLYICTTSYLSIPLSIDVWTASMSWLLWVVLQWT